MNLANYPARFCLRWRYRPSSGEIAIDIIKTMDVKDGFVVTHADCHERQVAGFGGRLRAALRVKESIYHPLLEDSDTVDQSG